MKSRSSSLPSLVCAILASVGAALGQAGPYRVTGTVVSSTTGQSVPHCHLTPSEVRDPAEGSIGAPSNGSASAAGDPRGSSPFGPGRMSRRGGVATADAPAGFDCDERGRFSFALAGPGRWRVLAAAPGYRSAFYDEHESFSSAVVVSPSVPTVDLHFRLDPDSSIAGYILDEADEPVRNANVQIHTAGPTITGEGTRFTRSYAARTDDRGRYEVAELAPGNYQILVQGQPWYAAGAPQMGGRNANAPVNPALDVVYPLTWYPSVTDPASAGVLSLRAGEEREASLRLLPIPSVHLHIPAAPADPGTNNVHPPPRFPQVAQLTPNGGMMFLPLQTRFGPTGDVDVGGLGPGTYQLTLQNPGRQQGAGEISILHVAPGSSQTLEISAAVEDASLTIKMDGAETDSLNLAFTDLDSGRVIGVPNEMRRRQKPPAGDAEGQSPSTVQIPAGRYQVTLQGTAEFYLQGLLAEGAEVHGRVVTIHGGSPTLTLHVGRGRSSVSGLVTLRGKLDPGAMVLLVPASLGDPASMPIVRRDQTDLDGEFRLPAVLPGRYILLAIDHGWVVNWNDPTTLSQYLLHGVPLDLGEGAKRQQDIEAQTP